MKSIKKKVKYMRDIEEREGVCIEELLRRKFVDENKPAKQIADELGTSYITTFKLLKMAGIYSRKLKL